MQANSQMETQNMEPYSQMEVQNMQVTPFPKETLSSAVVLIVWFSTVLILSIYGVWTALPFWVFPLTVVFGVTVPFLMYLKVPNFHAFINSFSIRALTLYHIWRVIAGFYFLVLGTDGYLPLTFAYIAGFGDMAVGLVAIVFIFWRPQRTGYLVFHIFSMVDFVLAVGTGFTLTVLQVPLMEHIQRFPVALIPGFGVGVTGALSLITLYRLLKTEL